jgi:hypothetical protein
MNAPPVKGDIQERGQTFLGRAATNCTPGSSFMLSIVVSCVGGGWEDQVTRSAKKGEKAVRVRNERATQLAEEVPKHKK